MSNFLSNFSCCRVSWGRSAGSLEAALVLSSDHTLGVLVGKWLVNVLMIGDGRDKFWNTLADYLLACKKKRQNF